MQLGAIWILTQVHMYRSEGNMSSDYVLLGKESSSREDFVRRLVDILTDDNHSISKREYVGDRLSMQCLHGGISYATTVIQKSGDVVDSLTKLLVQKESVACRETAADILKHLCAHYTKDDECLAKLKKAVTTVLPEVIEEILGCGDKTHTGEGAHQDGFAQQKTDIENQHAANPSSQQDGEKTALDALKLSIWSANCLSSLLYLCGTVYDTFINEFGPDLVSQFHASNFLNKLKEITVTKGKHPTVENLSVLKAITNMVTSMMKPSSSFVKQEDLQILIEALSSASKNMTDLDYSMVFRSTSSQRTLASSVKEAQELHAMLPSTSVSG